MARDHDESLDDSQTDNLDDSQTENLEHSVSDDSFNSRARIRKKKKPPRVMRRKVSYCPNTSSTSFGSFNRSSRRSSGKNAVSRQYKKINAQLAQNLNYVKVELNQAKEELLVVKGEKLALQTENATLRGQVDPQIVEQEVQRRLFESIGPVKDCLNAALDNMVGLSDNLTQGLRLTTATSRVSLNRQSGSSVALNRNSSIGTMACTSASSFRMRNATNFPPPSSNSPNRALPKSMVSPMVAGHTIKRPKIQLNRIAMQDGVGAIYVGENPVQHAPLQPDQTTEEEEEEDDEAEVESAEEEPEEDIAPSPNRPRRNRFNLTIIGEESRIEDSPLPASQPLERLNESDEDDGVQVLSGNVVDPDVGLLHTPHSQPSQPSPSSSGRRSRASVGRDLRITTEDAEQDLSIRRKSRTAESQRLSGMRQRLLASTTTPVMGSPASSSGAMARTFVGKPSRTSTGVLSRNSSGGIMRSPAGSSRSSLSNTPLGRLSRSPYVDVMRTARHPHVLLSDLVISRHPAALGAASSHSPNTLPSRASSSPVVMDNNDDDNEGLEEDQGGNVFNMSNMPADPSDSFLERMCEENPLEGPSWLFATIKKKKGKKSSKGRMTAARRLSTVLSVGSQESNSSARTTLSFDTSDLTADRSTDASEVSGFVPGENILAPDLVGNPGVEETRLDLVDMEETEAHGIGLDDSGEDKENVSGEGDDNFIMVDGERTPLKELVFMNGGAAVRYNPELETGVTVESLKEAKILLDNIGVKGRRYSIDQDRLLSEEHSARVRLSECYIDLSGGGACLVAPLDQMINISGAGTPRGGVGTPRGGVGTPQGGVGTPRGGVGTPQGGVGTPRGGVGTPRGGVGTPRGGVGTPRGGVGTPLVVEVGAGRNIEQREYGEERRSVSIGKKRRLSNLNDEVIQNVNTASKRSRKTGGSSRIGKVRYSNVRRSDVRSISHASRVENEQRRSEHNDFGEGKISENQKRINDRKSRAFLPAFIPFTPPNRAKKMKEKSQRMPRSKAAAQLLETDDDNEDDCVQSQPSTSDLVTTSDDVLEKELVIDDMQQKELEVNSEEIIDFVEPDQQTPVDDTPNDEEIDFIESPVITPKKKKKAKSTFSRTRLSEFENLSPEMNRCKSAGASKMASQVSPISKMDQDFQDLTELAEESQPSKKSPTATPEMPEETILPVGDKFSSSTDVPALSQSIDGESPSLLSPRLLAGDEVVSVSKEVEPEPSKNSPAEEPEISRRPRGRTTMIINYAEPEHSPVSVSSKEVEPEPNKKSPGKGMLELKKKAVSESFKPAEPEISRRPRGRTTMNINYAEPEDSPLVDLTKKARSRNTSGKHNSGDKNSKNTAKQEGDELVTLNVSPEPEISRQPRGRTTMVINYAEQEDSPVVNLTKKFRSRNTSGKKNKSTADENVKLNVEDAEENEESTAVTEKVKKSRIKQNSGDKNSKSTAKQGGDDLVASNVSPANPNAGEGMTKETTDSSEDKNTKSVASKKSENSHVSMEGNVDKTKVSEHIESVTGSSSAKSSDISAQKEPIKENLNKKKSKTDNNEVAPEEVKDEGRSRRRAASAVSYKEPSIGKKLRQGDQHSVSVYNDFVPQTKKSKKKK